MAPHAALLRGLQQQCPNLLGHLLVANENDARQARESLVAAGLHGTITVATLAIRDAAVHRQLRELADRRGGDRGTAG